METRYETFVININNIEHKLNFHRYLSGNILSLFCWWQGGGGDKDYNGDDKEVTILVTMSEKANFSVMSFLHGP